MATQKHRLRPIRFIMRLMKKLMWFIVFLAIFSLALGILVQFKFFRTWALGELLAIANMNLEAKVELSDLKFSGFSGINLYGLKLITVGDTLVEAEKVSAQIFLHPFMNNKLRVRSLKLYKPKIKLLRSAVDSTWNFTHIAKPKPKTETEGKPKKAAPEWIINIRGLKIYDGEMSYIDSTVNYVKRNVFDFKHMMFRNINLAMNANLELSDKSFVADIYKLGCNELNSGFDLEHLSLNMNLDTNGIVCDNIFIDAMGQDIELDASLKKFNPFNKDPDQINNSIMKADLVGKNIKMPVIKLFGPFDFAINGAFDIDLLAEGTLKELDLSKLIITENNTKINLTAKLKHLRDKERLSYSVNLDGTQTTKDDIARILSDVDLTKIPDFGQARLNDFYAYGRTDSVFADMNISSSIGKIIGKVGLGFFASRPYFAEINIEEADLGKTLPNDTHGKINGKIDLKGRGFDINSMASKLEVNLQNSKYNQFDIASMKLKLNILKGLVSIDSLDIQLINKLKDSVLIETGFYNEFSDISFNGTIDIMDENPEYKLFLKYNALNLSSLLSAQSMPQYLSGEIILNGSGFNPDSIELNMTSKFNDFLIYDRYLMPFEVNATVTKNDNNSRLINVYSPFFSMNMKGKYTTNGLKKSSEAFAGAIKHFIVSRSDVIVPEIYSDSTEKSIVNPQPSLDLPEENIVLNLRIFNDMPFDIFLDNMTFKTNSSVNLIYKTNNDGIELDLRSLQLMSLSVESDDLNFTTDPVELRAYVVANNTDSTMQMKEIDLSLKGKGTSSVNNSANITEPFLEIDYTGKNFELSSSSKINDIIEYKTEGNIYFDDEKLSLTLDTLNINYLKEYLWKVSKPISADFSPSGLIINSFAMYRDSAEKIYVTGKYDSYNKIVHDLEVKLKNIRIEDFLKPEIRSNEEQKTNLWGEIDSLVATIDGSLDNPTAKLKLSANSLKFNNFKVGFLSADLTDTNSTLSGIVQVRRLEDEDSPKIADIKINSFPADISISPDSSRFSSKKGIDASINLLDFSLQAVSPFIPNVSDLNGFASAEVKLKGSGIDDIQYNGRIDLSRVSFISSNNNLKYLASGGVNLENNLIEIDNVQLKNSSEDKASGTAEVNGRIDLDGFEPEFIDISVDASNLLVLSDASRTAMPMLYGNLTVSTGSRPLRFYGTMDRPNLQGDINVLSGDLKMPQSESNQTVKTRFEYEIMQDTIRYRYWTYQDSTGGDNSISNDELKKIQASFADLMNFDMKIKILNPVDIMIGLGSFGKVQAKIATPDPDTPIFYIKKRNASEATLRGELALKDGSKVYYFKSFQTTGRIFFPTGSMNNPSLDLEATHSGMMNDGENQKRYNVYLNITGTKENPKLQVSYSINGQEATGDKNEIQKQALSLLLTGQINQSGGSGLNNPNLVSEIGTSGISSFASKSLTDLLLGTGVIQSADVDFRGDDLDEATVKLSGQLFGVINWTIGGAVADLANNNEISINIPITEMDKVNWLFEFTKLTTLENQTQTDRDAKDWEIKVKLSGSW